MAVIGLHWHVRPYSITKLALSSLIIVSTASTVEFGVLLLFFCWNHRTYSFIEQVHCVVLYQIWQEPRFSFTVSGNSSWLLPHVREFVTEHTQRCSYSLRSLNDTLRLRQAVSNLLRHPTQIIWPQSYYKRAVISGVFIASDIPFFYPVKVSKQPNSIHLILLRLVERL